jgi:hypothetical protein
VAYRALNRRKLLVISGRLNAGLWIYLEDLGSMGASAPLSISAAGMTCCRSLFVGVSLMCHICPSGACTLQIADLVLKKFHCFGAFALARLQDLELMPSFLKQICGADHAC